MQKHPPTIHVPSLVDALYTAIRERILTGQLAGGTPLTELDLATQYSVARPSAKAAMERLVHDGLLWRASNKTARVPVLTDENVRDLYYARGFLEREIMLALADRKLVLPDARRLVSELREVSTRTGDVVTRVVEIDIAFHRSLVDALDSPRLSRLYESLIGEVHLSMAQVQANELVSRNQIADEHHAMLDSIEAGDSATAVAVMTTHLQQACERLVRHIDAVGVAHDGRAVST